MSFLLWWYSNSLKRQPFIGNFVVALLIGLSIELVKRLVLGRELFGNCVFSLCLFYDVAS